MTASPFRIFLILLLLPPLAGAQVRDTTTRSIDFRTELRDDGLHFTPLPPPLQQVAGAPPAFFDYYWEFGDGAFSFSPQPRHVYAAAGEYDVLLLATGKYDNGKPPRTRKKTSAPPPPKSAVAALDAPPDVIREPGQALGLRAIRDPRPGEELVVILAYRNQEATPLSGKLHVFFNQHSYKTTHFQFAEARTHHGEEETTGDAVGFRSPAIRPGEAWASLAPAMPAVPPAGEPALLELLAQYREQRAWSFENLEPGAVRHLFVSLQATEQMLADTNATITLSALLLPGGGGAPERRDLELEIVASHDPNHISVKPHRTGFRGVRGKDLEYEVKFQNTGEGPAGRVEVTCTVPPGLEAGAVQVLDFYPRCYWCHEVAPGQSCLDSTLLADRIVFTFRNIYLPGVRQAGVDDRDSTRGFIRYRLTPGRGMRKLPLGSRASIVFDKNEPIRTNRTHTHFKPGFSPGLIAAYALRDPWRPDADSWMIGASLSPYKPYRPYFQVEAYAGAGRSDEEITPIPRTTLRFIDERGFGGDTRPVVIDSSFGGEQVRTLRVFSLAVSPLQVRHNLTGFLGVGAGALVGVSRVRESVSRNLVITRNVYFCRELSVDTPRERCEFLQEFSGSFDAVSLREDERTEWDLSLFADVSLGAVRRGPSLGLRPMLCLTGAPNFLAFVYLSVKI